MAKRFVSIWFRYLLTDWFALRNAELHGSAFILSASSHGRMIVTATNAMAEAQDIIKGMVVADARAIIHELQVKDDPPGLGDKLLHRLAAWCIRFSPFVSVDPPDGLLMDVTGCSHLWGGDEQYVDSIRKRLKERGYTVQVAIADTIGAAWALARFGRDLSVVEKGKQLEALLSLPPASLRLDAETVERLHKLGLNRIYRFIHMPRPALRRRFGSAMIKRLNQALGNEEEMVQPVQPVERYQERLPCLEPISTATGIAIALQRLLDSLCERLRKEQKGLRCACFKGYRIDGKTEQVTIGTNRATCNATHLSRLFEDKLCTIEPDLGIELFTLEASKVEDHIASQEKIWENTGGLNNTELSELLDRLAGKIGEQSIRRYLPDEHYWPERSLRPAVSLDEKPATAWHTGRPRPIQLLSHPHPIQVMAPVPDYPPMNFRYNGKLHTIKKADGPERIEQEWWIEDGQHRDYYLVEDEEGKRYWLFRSGHYSAEKNYRWYLHGFFA